MTSPRKKLIEVALPLDAINAASAREKSIRHGHPSTLHLWWARRPLAAARVTSRLGASADIARKLAYRLYIICERKRRAAEALSYNSLVQSWPEVADIARQKVPD